VLNNGIQINITKNLLKSPHAVKHIDSRVKIIDNERRGAGSCDLLLVIVRVL
jgi:hypothetical protein